MTPADFRAAREALGLTAKALSHIMGVDISTVQRWEATGTETARAPHPIAVKVLRWMMQHGRPQEWPTATP